MTTTVPAPEALVFEQPTLSTRGRGRPALFTASIQAALASRPGEFAVIQTGIRSVSRVSVLKRKYPDFDFASEPVGDGTIKVYARARVEAPVEVEAPAPAPKRTRPSRSKAALAARAAEAAAE